MMEAQPEIKQRRFAWFRWIWRAGVLIVVILLVGIVVPVIQNGRTIHKLDAIEVNYGTEPGILLQSLPWSWQSWLYSTLGAEHSRVFDTVTQISWEYQSVSDSDLSVLRGLTRLESLELRGCKFNNSALVPLRGLVNLETLLLNGLALDDEGLSHTAGLSKLEWLCIGGSRVSDTGLVHLKDLSNLKYLDLIGTKFTNAGLVHLEDLTNLQQLDLSLAEGGLGAPDFKISDVGLKHLRKMTKLESLSVDFSEVSDVGLIHLKRLTKLKLLGLNSTKVTRAGVAQLQAALPDCEIQYSETVITPETE